MAGPILLVMAVVACGDTDTAVGPFDGRIIVSAEIIPPSAIVQVGAEQQFIGRVTLDDGSTVDVTSQVTWSTTLGDVDNFGLYTADQTPGTSLVIATDPTSGLADTATVTIVAAATLASITVTPPSVSLAQGQTRQFSASGTLSNGAGTPVTVTWSATGGFINSSGLYTAGTTDGTFMVVATENTTGRADTAQVTITNAAPTLVSITVSPAQVTLPAGASRQFNATGTMSDGSSTAVSVSWNATGGTITASGVYTAGQSPGTFQVTATESGAGVSDNATVNITPPPVPGVFPVEYSLTRPLLQNNPGALLTGEDWQWASRTSDLNGFGFYINKNNANTSGLHADASTISVPYTPGARRAEIAQDATFGPVVRLWQTDRSDGDEHTVYFGRGWSGRSKVWIRVLMKFQSGFTTAGPGSGANAWKVIFTNQQREMEITNTTGYVHQFNPPYGGTQRLLPGTRHEGSTNWSRVDDEWTNEEWYEFIFYEERVSATQYRNRKWVRRLTNNGVVIPLTGNHAADWRHAWGGEVTGATVPANNGNHIQMGINRNKPMYTGDVQWWMWGPFEVIDGDVIPDPYGIANDML